MEKEDRIIELLEALVKAQLSPIFVEEMKNPKLKKLYAMTGKERIREIEKKIGMSKFSISTVWQKWEQLGLIKKQGKFYKKII
ncbi:MAG: hypothetical protein ABI543_10820 [Ignavibacteria bacterium]